MSEVSRRKNILIIAEGFEEKPYIDKILSFPNINKEVYCFAKSINVKGNGNIPARYQFEIQRGFYDIILIFCDADKGSDQFIALVNDIGNKFFIEPKYGIEVFIFANPVTLQIILSHFGDVKLVKVAKKANAEVVKKLTGIPNYDAKQKQIEELVQSIHFSSIKNFKERLDKISQDFCDLPSTNFLTFLKRFESEDSSWVESINKLRKR